MIIENGKFEIVSDFSVVDKSSSILKERNIDIIEESQSPCSLSLTRGIGNSVDDIAVPDLLNIGCSKSCKAEDNFINDKFDKETGRYWSGDKNSDVNTYQSDDNENVSVGNETEPIFVKIHPFFDRPVGEMCKDKCFNEKEKVKLHLPDRVKDKESDLFNFHIFANHYKNIKVMTTKNMPGNFSSLEDFLSKTLPEPHCHVSAKHLLHWVNSGSGQNCVAFKGFLCGCFNPFTVGNVAASYCKFTFTGDIFSQFVMDSDVKMEVACVLCPMYQYWKKGTMGNASKMNANTLEG